MFDFYEVTSLCVSVAAFVNSIPHKAGIKTRQGMGTTINTTMVNTLCWVIWTVRKRWAYSLPAAVTRQHWCLSRDTMPLHAPLNTPLCILTLLLWCKISPVHSAPVMSSDSSSVSDYYANNNIIGNGPPKEGEMVPGYKYSFEGTAVASSMYEGVIICLLAITAFVGLVVWVLKSNFEERQTRRMRREASLRDRNSNVSPLMTPDSEES